MSDSDCICARCGLPIAEGEPAIAHGSGYICEDCALPYAFYARDARSYYFEEVA